MTPRRIFGLRETVQATGFRLGLPIALILLALALAPATAGGEQHGGSVAPVRGVVTSSWEAVVSAQLSERVLALPFGEGEKFDQGEELIRFDCVRLRAEAKAQKALFDAKAALHDANERRAARGAAGSLEVEVSRAERAASEGRYEAAESLLRDCSIKAPFAGRVVERHIEVFEVPAQSMPLLTILKDDDLEVHIIAPSQWLSWMDVGSRFKFTVDETGRTYQGQVARLGASVDPVSQTFKLIGHLERADGNVVSGMSGNAIFEASRSERANAETKGRLTR